MQKHLDEDARILATNYIQKLPEIYRVLLTDVQATLLGDPAAQSEYEVIELILAFTQLLFIV
jgi:serine O-acetyltransferase